MLLKLPAVMRETALSRSSIYSAIKHGRFPRPVKVGKRAVAWRAEDIALWRAGLSESNGMPIADRPTEAAQTLGVRKGR